MAGRQRTQRRANVLYRYTSGTQILCPYMPLGYRSWAIILCYIVIRLADVSDSVYCYTTIQFSCGLL